MAGWSTLPTPSLWAYAWRSSTQHTIPTLGTVAVQERATTRSEVNLRMTISSACSSWTTSSDLSTSTRGSGWR